MTTPELRTAFEVGWVREDGEGRARERSWDVITAKCAGLRGYADRAAPPTQRPVTPRHSSRALCQIAGAALPSAPVLRRAGERPPRPPRTLIIVKAGSRNAKISPHPQIDNAAPRRASAVFYALSVRQLRPRSRFRGGRRAGGEHIAFFHFEIPCRRERTS